MISQFTAQDYSELHLFQDLSMDFFAAICLHANNRGPAIGGCRFIHYATKDDAIQDAIRLSKAMRNKAAVSELPHDGGKAVIMLPSKSFDRHAFLKKFAECVDSLHGKYITTIDSGTTQEDMAIIKKYTSFVTGDLTGTERDSNPSDATALGVYTGIKAAVKLKLNKDSLNGLHIAIQGVGSVGNRLAKLLHRDGVKLTVADTNENHLKKLLSDIDANVVAVADIIKTPCDVFSPCALGRVINKDSIAFLKTPIIAGAANDQLATDDLADILHAQGVLYIPDYVINAGGLIDLALQLQGKDKQAIENEVKKIGNRIRHLADVTQSQGVPLLQGAHA